MRRVALVVLVAALWSAAAAQASPIVIQGKAYASLSEYFRSGEFQSRGLRCGTLTPWERQGLPRPPSTQSVQGGPEDCSLTSNNPSDEYIPGNIWEITVVVHRFESTTGDGVYPDSLVRTQIEVLNEDFRALAGTPGEPGADTRIQFRLATHDPDGNPHPGWTRTTNEFWFNDLPDPVNGNYWDAVGWDPARYLNIYTLSPVAPGGLILGYVQWFPQEGAGLPDDGVRILWNAFGRQSTNAPYDLGRTATHEVGHYLGLYHTFQDGCGDATTPGCRTTGDLICDTNPEAESHFGCETESQSCGLPDPVRNYMDYSDDFCMTNFTIEQARRMRCATQHYRPSLYNELVVAVDPVRTPVMQARLEQNRPNPFGGSTEFGFELPEAGQATLTVIDVSGRVVRTLATGPAAEGRHRFGWDGTDDRGGAMPPGVYFYRLTTAAGSTTKRMVMLQ